MYPTFPLVECKFCRRKWENDEGSDISPLSKTRSPAQWQEAACGASELPPSSSTSELGAGGGQNGEFLVRQGPWIGYVVRKGQLLGAVVLHILSPSLDIPRLPPAKKLGQVWGDPLGQWSLGPEWGNTLRMLHTPLEWLHTVGRSGLRLNWVDIHVCFMSLTIKNDIKNITIIFLDQVFWWWKPTWCVTTQCPVGPALGHPTHPCIWLPPNWSPPDATGDSTSLCRPPEAAGESLSIYFQVCESEFWLLPEASEACRNPALEKEVGCNVFCRRSGKVAVGKLLRTPSYIILRSI